MKGLHLFLINTSTYCRKRPPLDKFCALYRLLHIEFHGFNRRIEVSGLSHVGYWYYLIFRDSIGLFYRCNHYRCGLPLVKILCSKYY